MREFWQFCLTCVAQLFQNLDKVVFLDDDVVVQRDLSLLWEVDLGGKVNGAVETCKGEDEWVMSKRFRNYFNFSHPLIAKNLNPDEPAWAYGMNIFDLCAWRKTNITDTYHAWLKEVNLKYFMCHTSFWIHIVWWKSPSGSKWHLFDLQQWALCRCLSESKSYYCHLCVCVNMAHSVFPSFLVCSIVGQSFANHLIQSIRSQQSSY